MGNELVAEVKESETVWSGSRLLEDGADLKEAFESKSWVAGGLGAVATAADTAAAVMDPLGEALSAGVGWIIEHLGSLNEWLNELTGDSDAVAAAASTWTNIGTKLSSCATDLDTVCSSRLAGQESLAVATFKTLQAGSASHLRMTGELAGAISGGLTVASVIVRMVHDMVRDAISDVIGKLASKVAIGALTAGLAAPWTVTSAITEVSSWVTRLSKEVTDVVTSSKNLKMLLDKAEKIFSWLAKKWESLKASRAKKAEEAAEAATDGTKSAEHAADAAADGAKGAASAAGAAATSAKRAGSAADAAADGAKSAGHATDAVKTGKNADKYQKDIPELFRQHQAQKAAKRQAIERLDEAMPEGYSRSDFTRKRISDTSRRLKDVDGYSRREIENLKEMAGDVSKARKDLNDAAARIGEAGGEAHLTENGYHEAYSQG